MTLRAGSLVKTCPGGATLYEARDTREGHGRTGRQVALVLPSEVALVLVDENHDGWTELLGPHGRACAAEAIELVEVEGP